MKELAIDPALHERARGERCRIDECNAACCSNGVWVDRQHIDLVRAHAADIAPLIAPGDRDPATWFRDEPWEHPDYPSGVGFQSRTVARADLDGVTRCVLLTADHLCALQIVSRRLGMAGTGLKPIDCATFPLVACDGVLWWDSDSIEGLGADCQRPCQGEPQRRFEVFKEEVELAIGRQG